MNPGPDFIITAHALDRIHERYPELIEGLEDDQEVGEWILAEVVACMEAGRMGSVAPRSLSPYGRHRWQVQAKDTYIVWNEDKMRGYVLHDKKEGTLVLTVLRGRELDR